MYILRRDFAIRVRHFASQKAAEHQQKLYGGGTVCWESPTYLIGGGIKGPSGYSIRLQVPNATFADLERELQEILSNTVQTDIEIIAPSETRYSGIIHIKRASHNHGNGYATIWTTREAWDEEKKAKFHRLTGPAVVACDRFGAVQKQQAFLNGRKAHFPWKREQLTLKEIEMLYRNGAMELEPEILENVRLMSPL